MNTLLKRRNSTPRLASSGTKVNELKAVLESEVGVHDLRRKGIEEVNLAYQQSRINIEENIGSMQRNNELLQSGQALTAAYGEAWGNAVLKFQSSVTALAAVDAELDVMEELLRNGAAQTVAYGEGWNTARQHMVDMQTNTSSMKGEFDKLNEALEKGTLTASAFNEGWNQFRLGLVKTIEETARMTGEWESFVDALQDDALNQVMINIQKGFADGLKSAQDFFQGILQEQGAAEGYIKGLQDIAGALTGLEPASLTGTQALQGFMSAITGPQLDAIVQEWADAGQQMIDGVVEAGRKGSEDFGTVISEIEQQIGFRLTDTEKWQIKFNIDKQNFFEELAQIEQDIGRTLTDPERWKVAVRAETTDMTEQIVNGINLAANIAGDDPSAFVESAKNTGMAMFQKLGSMSAEAQQALKPLIDALMAPVDPTSKEGMAVYVNGVQTALAALNPDLAASVGSLVQFGGRYKHSRNSGRYNVEGD